MRCVFLPREGYKTITVTDVLYNRIAQHQKLGESIPDVLYRVLETFERIPAAVAAVIQGSDSESEFFRGLASLREKKGVASGSEA